MSSPRERGATLARAGDIAREADRREEALAFYGSAIDAYLEAGISRAAEVLCRRLIEMEPNVVRTRYTLTMIAVGRDDVEEAERRLLDYMAAVERTQVVAQALPSLLQMAAVTSNQRMRRTIAEAVRQAGREELADRIESGEAAPAHRTSWAGAVAGALKRPWDVDVEALEAAR